MKHKDKETVVLAKMRNSQLAKQAKRYLRNKETTFTHNHYNSFANTRRGSAKSGQSAKCNPSTDKTHWNHFRTREGRKSFSKPDQSTGSESNGESAKPKTTSIAVLKCRSPRSSVGSLSSGDSQKGSSVPRSDFGDVTAGSDVPRRRTQSTSLEQPSLNRYVETDLTSRMASMKTGHMLTGLYKSNNHVTKGPNDKAVFSGMPLLFPPVRIHTSFPYYKTLNPLSQNLCPGHLILPTPSSQAYRHLLGRGASSQGPKPREGCANKTESSTESVPYKLRYTSVPNDIQRVHKENLAKLSQIAQQNDIARRLAKEKPKEVSESDANEIHQVESANLAQGVTQGDSPDTRSSHSSDTETGSSANTKQSEGGKDATVRSRDSSPKEMANRHFRAKMCRYRQNQKVKLNSRENNPPCVVGINPIKRNPDLNLVQLPSVLSLQISLPRVSIEDTDDNSLASESLTRIPSASRMSAKRTSAPNILSPRFFRNTDLTRSLPLIIVSDESGDETYGSFNKDVNDITENRTKKLRVVPKGSVNRPGSSPLHNRSLRQGQSNDRALSASRITNLRDICKGYQLNSNSPYGSKESLVSEDSVTTKKSKCACKVKCDQRYCRYVAMARPRSRHKKQRPPLKSPPISPKDLPSLKFTTQEADISKYSKLTTQKSKFSSKSAEIMQKVNKFPRCPPKSAPQNKTASARRAKMKLRPISREDGIIARPGSVDIVSYMAARCQSPLTPEIKVERCETLKNDLEAEGHLDDFDTQSNASCESLILPDWQFGADLDDFV